MKRIILSIIISGLASTLSFAQFAQAIPEEKESPLSENYSPDCQPPELSGASVCTGQEALLEADGDGITYKWYQDVNGLQEVGTGPQFTTPALMENTVFKVQAVCPFSQNDIKKITTEYNGGNGKEGIMFDLVADTDITLTGFDINMADGTADCYVFYREGGIDYAEMDPDAWNLWDVVSLESAGRNEPTSFNVQDLYVESGKTYGIYISFEEIGHLNYSNGPQVFDDGIIEISNGKGIGWPFLNVCTGRVFNGAVHYAEGGYPTSAFSSVEVEVNDPPAQPSVVSSGERLIASDADSYEWYLNGGQIEGADEQVYWPEESGAYSVITYNGGCPSSASLEAHYAESDLDDTDPEAIQAEVFPNPTSEVVNVRFDDSPAPGSSLVLTDASGRILEQRAIQGNYQIQFNLSEYSKGNYHIHYTGIEGNMADYSFVKR